MSKGGIEGHKAKYLPESQKLTCTHSNWNVTFGRPQSLKKHLKTVHGKQKKVYCKFYKKSFKTKDNKVAHEMGCKRKCYKQGIILWKMWERRFLFA